MLLSLFSKIKKISANPLTENFVLVGGVQSINLLIPLFLTPYLVRTVGLSNFGKIVFCQSVISILNMLIDYGYNLSATRTISINRQNAQLVNTVYTVTFLAKLVLTGISFVIMVLLFAIPAINGNKVNLLLTFLISIGQMLTPIWAFQGIEKLRVYSIINAFFRSFYIISVFVFIKRPEQYIYANAFLGLSGICVGITSIIYLNKKYKLRFTAIQPGAIITSLKDGFYYFVSTLSVNIYTYINSSILLFFTSYTAVGLYGVIEKILQALKQILSIYTQVIHPAACRLADTSYTQYKRFLKKAYLPLLFAFVLLCALLFTFAPVVVKYFNASNTNTAVFLLHIAIFSLLFTCLNIPAYITLLALHFPKTYSLVLLSAAVISVLCNILLTYAFGLTGCIINILITEFLIMAGLHIMLQFKHKQYALFKL